MTDQEIVLRALTELQLIAEDYIEPDARDAEITMQVDAVDPQPQRCGRGRNPLIQGLWACGWSRRESKPTLESCRSSEHIRKMERIIAITIVATIVVFAGVYALAALKGSGQRK
jgi:hypothetical protein